MTRALHARRRRLLLRFPRNVALPSVREVLKVGQRYQDRLGEGAVKINAERRVAAITFATVGVLCAAELRHDMQHASARVCC